MQDASNGLHVLILGAKMCLQWCSKLVITKPLVAEIVGQRFQGHKANNRECPTTKHAATMSWNDELVAAVLRPVAYVHQMKSSRKW